MNRNKISRNDWTIQRCHNKSRAWINFVYRYNGLYGVSKRQIGRLKGKEKERQGKEHKFAWTWKG